MAILMTTGRAAALALLLLPALALAAAAQVGPLGPAVTVELGTERLELGAANVTSVNATVTNPGNLAGSVVVEIVVPEGWSVVAEPETFPLAAGAAQPVLLTLTAPEAGVGAADGGVTMSATLTDQSGGSASATGSFLVTRVDPVVVPPPPPPYGLYASLAVVAVTLLAGAIVFKRRRDERLQREAAEAAARAAYFDRETGIGIRIEDGPIPFGGRRAIVFRVTVENTSQRPRVAVLGVADRPSGWTVAPSVPRVNLAPAEANTLSFVVTPDEGVPGGAVARLAFTVKPEEAQERHERVDVEIVAPTVVAVGAKGDAALVRGEQGVPRPALRR